LKDAARTKNGAPSAAVARDAAGAHVTHESSRYRAISESGDADVEPGLEHVISEPPSACALDRARRAVADRKRVPPPPAPP
jgi:hypothetical protein